MDDVLEKKFRVAKNLVQIKMSRDTIGSMHERDVARLQRVNIKISVLVELLEAERKKHDAAIKMRITKVDKLRYKGPESMRAKILRGYGVPYERISQLIDKHPEDKAYEITRRLVDEFGY